MRRRLGNFLHLCIGQRCIETRWVFKLRGLRGIGIVGSEFMIATDFSSAIQLMLKFVNYIYKLCLNVHKYKLGIFFFLFVKINGEKLYMKLETAILLLGDNDYESITNNTVR